MSNRIVAIMLALVGASPAAAVHRHHAARVPLLSGANALSAQHIEVTPPTGADLVVAPLPPPPVNLVPSFVAFHSARVKDDLMLFQPTLLGATPLIRSRNGALLAGPPAASTLRFFAPAQTADQLAVLRDRDKLLLFRGAQPQGAALGIGIAMFGATTMLSAHAPRPLRILFDGPVHLGPAVFDGGGIGAGIAGHGF